MKHCTIVALVALSLAPRVYAEQTAVANAILEAAGFTGGLVVHVDCNDGSLTAALKTNDATIVHGLDTSESDVATARQRIHATGRYGGVSVDLWEGVTLPYADNLVNLIVVDEMAPVRRGEILRVLCPGGSAVFLSQKEADSPRIARQFSLKKLAKPWPAELDEWTHFLHDPSNNAVAQDKMIGPPGRLQWTAGPMWSKEHDVTPSVFAPVSSKGRLFYILNEGPICTIDQRLPDHYSVVARDAFNGITLWKRPMKNWYSSRVIWGHIPMHSQRRLVANGDRVYVTFGLQEPVTVLDAATGETIREYPGTDGASEIICSGGKLALVTRKTHPLDGLLAGRDGSRFRKGYTGPQEGGDELIVVSEDTGQCLWREPYRCMPQTLAVVDDWVLFSDSEQVICLDLNTAEPRWAASCSGVRTLVVHDNTVFAANAHPQKVKLAAFDLATGRGLWSREADSLPNFLFFFGPLDVFVARGLVWGMAEGLEWNKRPGSGHLLGLDPRTGETVQRIPLTGAFTTEHHVRCYKGKATEDYLLLNKRGIEFIDLVPGRPSVPNSYQWIRGVCRYGILPCNGLIYAPPHACACYPGAKVNGFLALAAKRPAWLAPETSTAPSRLVKGPAFHAVQKVDATSGHTDLEAAWPTYRGDRRRSGHTPHSVSADLAIAWETDGSKPAKLSSPVVAGGKVLAAAIDRCTVHAWDANDGTLAWNFSTGSRIDSPPTIHNRMALFGCRDGWVYCLRLDDGQLVWRFRAAPDAVRIGAFGRLESAWPVHGSVLVNGDIVYFAAGRSSFLDDGIFVYGIDATTGEVRHQVHLKGPDPQADTSVVTSGRMPGAVSDILTCDDTGLYMRHLKLDWQLSSPLPTQFTWGSKGESHLIAESGFLDDSLFNRSVWRYGIRIDRSQMLTIDGQDVYGMRVYEGISWNCAVHRVGDGHLIFRQDVSKPVPRPRRENVGRLNRIPTERYVWHTRLPIRVSAMLLAGTPAQRLFVAGVPDEIAPNDPLAFIEGRRGAVLTAIDAETGEPTARIELPDPPVWDGMAAAYGRLYITTTAGQLICLTGEKEL